MLQSFVDFVLGAPTRTIDSQHNTVYLTFDDGPNSYCTPRVLELLRKYDAKATFFVIGKHVEANLDVFKQIKADDHSIGNHTYDHNYLNYFKGVKHLEQWIRTGELIIEKHMGASPVGFRPPVGIRTPELRYVMHKRQQRPILWQHRFYDTAYPFTDARWSKMFSKIKNGDIILLHDTHKEPEQFLAALENFIRSLLDNGFKLNAIPYQNNK